MAVGILHTHHATIIVTFFAHTPQHLLRYQLNVLFNPFNGMAMCFSTEALSTITPIRF